MCRSPQVPSLTRTDKSSMPSNARPPTSVSRVLQPDDRDSSSRVATREPLWRGTQLDSSRRACKTMELHVLPAEELEWL